MDVFLFLYPIKPYIEHAAHRRISEGVLEKQMEFFNLLIEKRYRDAGYQISWLLFCQPNDSCLIDRSMLEPRVLFRDEDIVVNAGVPFADTKETWKYPSGEHIFAQLPEGITSLRLGGFHFSDCVQKIGRFAYRKAGLKNRVLIDEDLVDFFWSKTLYMFDPVYQERYSGDDLFRGITIQREMTYEGFGYTAHPDWNEDFWMRVRRIRNLNPWLVHK